MHDESAAPAAARAKALNILYSAIALVLFVGAIVGLAVTTAYLPNVPSEPMPVTRHVAPAVPAAR